jgi:hypothetical protein
MTLLSSSEAVFSAWAAEANCRNELSTRAIVAFVIFRDIF